jgi:hypothetical protein
MDLKTSVVLTVVILLAVGAHGMRLSLALVTDSSCVDIRNVVSGRIAIAHSAGTGQEPAIASSRGIDRNSSRSRPRNLFCAPLRHWMRANPIVDVMVWP